MIQGLYITLENKLSWLANTMEKIAKSNEPRESHEMKVASDAIASEIELLKASIGSEEILIEALGEIIEILENAKLKTAHRTLALRHLEDAQSRLMRDLGDKP